jgi:outer membrane lipoprotein SlyB
MDRVGTVAALLVLPILVGCGTKHPVLYPDAHAQQVGAAQQRRDVAECETLAKNMADSSSDVAGGARSAAVGGAVGATSGAAGGAIYGDAGRGAAAGAAGGVVAGTVGWLLRPRTPDPAYVGIVNQCLAARGYRVAGWR